MIGVLSGIDGCIVSYHNYNVKEFNATPPLVTFSVKRLFEHIDQIKSHVLVTYDVEIAILEVLNECTCVNDLVSKNMQGIFERKDDLTKIEVRSAQRTLEILEEACLEVSYNSSLMVTLYVTKRDARVSERITSKLHLITVVEPQKDQKKVLKEQLVDRPILSCLEDALKRCACEPNSRLEYVQIYLLILQ